MKIDFIEEEAMDLKARINGCRFIVYVLLIWLVCPLQAAAAGDLFIDLGRGPVHIYVPSSYDPETPTPLIMLLHGYGATGQIQEDYMQFAPIADEFGFIYLHPDGLTDLLGNQYWNATDACCDAFDANPDDSGYLRALIEEIRSQLNVDDRRVYIGGHSNGGFMAYRMACDHSDIVAAAVSLAGATYLDPTDCTPSEPVHILQIHGTADTIIFYGGGCLVNCYPGAVQSVETWAAYDGCEIVADNSSKPIDLDAIIPGNETLITKYNTNCTAGGSAELWTIVGGTHSPNLVNDFSQQIVEFLFAHPKPSQMVGDLDGDGIVSTTDLLILFSLWGPCTNCDDCPADLDGDCTVAVSDLLVLFANWG